MSIMSILVMIFTINLCNQKFTQAATFEISIKNISQKGGLGGQNISRPALIIHNERFNLFLVNHPASQILWEIAEDGDTNRALALQSVHPDVDQTFRLKRIRRDQSEASLDQFSIENPTGLRFSLAGMLTASNDAFAGINSHELPKIIGEKTFFKVRAWDAGSELNDEKCPFVPCNEHYIRLTNGAEGLVSEHKGIVGGQALNPIEHGWPSDNVVAEGQILRTN